MKVTDILRVKGNTLYTVTPDEPLDSALRTMVELDIGSLVVMDHGRIVARGAPRDLIARHSTRDVVEARHNDDEDVRRIVDRVLTEATRVEELPGRVLLYAEDGDALGRRLAELGITANRLYVRRSTLEDVFLHLAGRTLVD